MKYSVRKFTALLLALVMVLSIAPLDAVASVFSAYEANIVVDTSESVQISEAIVTSKVTSKDGFSAEVSSIDDILPADGWVGFSEAKKQEEEQTETKGPMLFATKGTRGVSTAPTRREVGRYNITVYDANGDEWQPGPGETVDVRVRLSSPLDLNPGGQLMLVHDPDGKAEDVPATFYKNTEGKLSGFAFEADGFSVYAVVEVGADARLKVIFQSNGEEIASMLVKENDIADNATQTFDTVVYDPGVGDLPAGTVFLGWMNTTNYDIHDEDFEAMSIEDVRNDIKGILTQGIHEGDSVTYYAVLVKQYTIDYLDENDVSVGGEVISYRADENNPTVAYTVNMSYTPADNEHAFMGWKVKQGGNNISGYEDGKIYENETEITINGDVVFSVNAPKGHWLVFNENGHGATFNAAQFVKSGDKTQKPRPDDQMLRLGYTFGGWYMGAPGEEGADPTGNEFVFDQELDDNITIYAKWIPNTSAAYTVIFWTQNIDRTGYDVAGSVVKQNGQVGQNIPYTVVENKDEDYVNGYAGYGHYTGFGLTEGSKNQEVKIRPEGDSVLNLYYDRIVYNFKFYMYRDSGSGNNRYTYANNSGNGSELNNIVTYHNASNNHPSTNDYTLTSEHVGSYDYYYFTITAYYGQDISDIWPTYDKLIGADNRDAVSFVMMVGTKLKPNPTSSGSGTVKGVISVLNENILGATNDANGNYVFIRFPGSYYNWRYHIWLETVAGEDYTGKTTRTYNGKTYYEETVMEVRSSNTEVSSQNEPKYQGFDFVEKRGQNWNNSNYWTTGNNPTLYHLNYVYNRQQYKISYFDGNYVDGNGNSIQNRASQPLHESGDIGQGATITDEYKNYVPDLPEGEEGYVFEGWYTDEGCTSKYIFNKMPVGGITVYAKWRQIQYRVFLHPNADRDPTLNWGSESQEMNFRVSYNGTVSAPTGLRTGYEFGGWYTNPNFNGVYNAGNYRLNEQTVTTSYDKTTHMTDEMDKWGEGATTNGDLDRFWITKEFNLYAKWITILNGADGIGILYDLNGGTGTAVDTNLYKDKAKAIAQPAVKAPDGEVFSHWVMQKWNGTAYADITGSVIYPGQPFDVLAANAKTVPVTDDDGNPVYVMNAQGQYLDENGNAIDQTKPNWEGKRVQKQTYTIQLKAQYKEPEGPQETHIWWFMNDGTNAFHEDNNILINEAVTIQGAPTRTGYQFIGWAKDKQEVDEEAPTISSAGLYLYYVNGQFRVGGEDGTVVTQVAADERTPYENMYAVWVPKLLVRITGNTATKTYNGNEQSVSGYTIEYKVGSGDWTTTAPDGVSVTLKTEGTDVATGTNVNTDPGYPMGLTKASFTVTPGTYNFDSDTDLTITDGWLKIEPKKVTITANSASKTYDGTALTDSGFTATALETGDTHTFTVVMTENSTITNVGTQPNVIATVDGVAVTVGTETAVGNYLVTTVNGTLEISKRTVTLTSATDSKVYDGTPLTNSNVTVGGDGWAEGEGATYDVTGTITNVGEVDNEFTYTLNSNTKADNYTITKTEGKLSITAVTEQVTVTITENSGSEKYDGQAHTIKGYESMTSSNTLYDVTTSVKETETDAWTVTKTDAGTYDMGIVAGDFENTNPNFTNVVFEIVDGQLEISKRTVTLTSATDSKVYDGTPLTNSNVTVGGDGWAEGEGATYDVTGSQTDVGNSPNEFTYTLNSNTKADNYTITTTEGTLTVTELTDKVTVTITENSGSEKYDGTEKTVTGYTVSIDNALYTEADFTFSGNDTVKGTNAGSYPMELKPEDFTNISENFSDVEFVIVDGTLEISKRTVTLTSATDSKVYDGTPLTNSNVTVGGDGWAEGEGATYDVTGTITNVGEVDNEFTYTLNSNTKADNYTITKTEGKLSITAVTEQVTVTITENSGSEKYDGQAHTIKGYESMTSSNTLYDVTTSVKETETDAWTVTKTDAGTYDMGIVAGDFENTNPNFTNVVFEIVDGQLEISKRTVTLTSATDSKVYDGTPLTNSNVTVGGDGWAEGEGATYDVTGTITNVGEVDNEFTYTLNSNTKADNYTITKTEGKLSITAVTEQVTVTITENSDEVTYDGQSHTITGYKTMVSDNDLYDVTTSVAETETDAWTVTKTDAGTYDMGIVAGDFENTNKNFTNVVFEIVDGQLKIGKRPVTLTSGDASKTYDTTALTNEDVEGKNDNGLTVETGWVEGEGATYSFTGSQTLVGNSPNAFTVTLKENTKADNYDITKTEGTLTVTDINVPNDLVVTKDVDEKEFALGEEVTFEITATNIYDKPMTIELIEIEGVTLEQDRFEDVAPGGQIQTTATYTIVEKDILAGSFENTVKARIVDLEKEASASAVVEPPRASIVVDKETTSTPANGTAYALGETIAYKITVKNDGNLTLTDVVVTDDKTGDEWTVDTLTPGESKEFIAEYVVTEADILAGSVKNDVTATGNPPDDKIPDPEDDDEVEDPTDEPKASLKVTKETTSTPADGKAYVLGETITYKITVENDGNLTLTDVIVTDEKTGDEWTVETLVPGDSEEFTAEYIVTEADVIAGSVKNDVTATGNPPDDKIPDPEDDDEVEDPTEEPKPSLEVTKKTTSTPADGKAYVLGEKITYEIVVKNNGNLTLTNNVVKDEKTGDEWKIDSLAPGETSKVFTAEYFVTEEDILAGSVMNSVTATGNPPDDKIPDPEDDDEVEDPTEDPNGHLTVNKETTSTPADEKGYAEGEVISYKITVVNDGNLTITKINVIDDLTGDKWPIESLEPGATKEFETTYTVTAADAAAGEVLNVATAEGKSPDPKNPEVPVTPGEDPEPTIETKFTLTIRYWIGSKDGELINTVTRVEKAGTAYDVATPPMEGYTADTERVKGVLDKDMEYDVVYTAEDYTLTILYKYQDGTEAAETYTEVLHFGDEYSVESPTINTYYPNKQKVEGTMPARDVTVTVIYVKYPVIITIDDFKTPLGLGLGSINVGETIE